MNVSLFNKKNVVNNRVDFADILTFYLRAFLMVVFYLQVAQKFYSLLVLKKHQVLKLEQNETYGPITISKGNQFETEAI